MKRVLCICNTYYQLLMGIVMKKTLFIDDDMIIVISNYSNNAELVAKKVKNQNIFTDVIYLRTKDFEIKQPNFVEAINIISDMVFGRERSPINVFGEKKVDLFLYYNCGLFTTSIFSDLYRRNPHIQAARFEEGILSYGNRIVLNKKQRIATIFRRILRKKNLLEITKKFYCVYPDFYNGDLETVAIPKIGVNDRGIADVLKNVFLESQNVIQYPQKYIFFSGVCDFEGGDPIGELQLILRIAKLVGNENLIVKVHPRDDPSRFLENGLVVDENSSAPWEAIQLNGEFSDKKFLTVFSGGVLSINMLLENPSQTFFLYPLCDMEKNKLAFDSMKTVERLLQYSCEKAAWPWIHRINELDDILK